MKAFTELYSTLDRTTRTNEKIAGLVAYFAHVPAEDAAWGLYFLSGRKPRQLVPTARLRTWARELSGIAPWLFDECYESVGDLAETIALLLPPNGQTLTLPLHKVVESHLLPLRGMDESAQREAVVRMWAAMDFEQRFVWNKLISGSFRVGVSQRLVVRALATVTHLDADLIAHRFMGQWEPTATSYQALTAPASASDASHSSRPYPFHLAYPLEQQPDGLGDIRAWTAEWKWDGIRAQLIKRSGQVFLWSRGEELISHSFPELVQAGMTLADGTVLDGEILPWRDNQVQIFGELQKRLSRKTVSERMLRENPVKLLAYDLLELDGQDLRQRPFQERRQLLEQILSAAAALGTDILRVSPQVQADSWEVLTRLRAQSHSLQVEGVMLKHNASVYRVGRHRGEWWKWKVEPYSIDAVMLYAQRGHGRRASLYTDYTFGVWSDGELVPFAKAYSGLTDTEIREVDRFIRTHTLETFGPVRSVKPHLVFELGFEGIQSSKRHKSGIAVRFPRILRWRKDKTINEANTLDDVKSLLPVPTMSQSEPLR